MIRGLLNDDASQGEAARHVLETAELVAIPVTVFCELAWVLGAGYKYSKAQVATSIGRYLAMGEVVTDRPAVEAGLAFLTLGGDFADGAVAHQGRMLGGVFFASFDIKAVKLLDSLGHAAFRPTDK